MPRSKKKNPTNPKKNDQSMGVLTENYRHPTAETLLRPEIGTQPQFRKKKPPVVYRYDSSLSPSLEWDGQNRAREHGEWLLDCVDEASKLPPPHNFSEPRELKNSIGEIVASIRGLEDAVEGLRRLSKPFLDWTGKAERMSFDVPTLPLFIHERLSTKAIIETLIGHKKDKQIDLDLFGDPQHSISDQVLKAYEYKDQWVNRLILGDSLVVMNSLLHYENMGGQVQMIYMDPPYGVKFGSNFQPFVRRRDVKHNDDQDMTREPEMVKAYRDTWELNEHSYLTYIRDRLLLARNLLHPTGSIFVQISDDNIHHVRELLDETFGSESFVGLISFVKTSGLGTADALPTATDYLLWYARDRTRLKFRQVYLPRESHDSDMYVSIELADGSRRSMTAEEKSGATALPEGSQVYRLDNLTKPGPGSKFEFEFKGKRYTPGSRWWGTTPEGMSKLRDSGRLDAAGSSLRYIRYWNDFPWRPLTNLWTDTGTGGFTDPKLYVVQTVSKVVQRCMMMTTDPGDLVFDPTCGSGTTAYVAEQWGRRWITADVSRVPLALARQRLLTSTFDFYELKDAERGPVSGFVYKRRQNRRGDEIGGIVPHITLKTIANSEPPDEEVLVDRPEVVPGITRVTGPFTFEATIPTAVGGEESNIEDSGIRSFNDRMLEILRRSPVLNVGDGKTANFKNIRLPARTLSLSAEAVVTNGTEKLVAFAFGPENGAVSERLVYEAAREAHAKNYAHLYVIGFAIQPNARKLVDDSDSAMGIAATYVQATPDLMMGDLLKNMRSSQIFSVCGLPEIKVSKIKSATREPNFQVELAGLDVFDPVTMTVDHRSGNDVPAWLLDTDYNGLCFRVCQAFFPRTSAWENLKKALKGTHDESVWDHLAGTISAQFQAGEHGQVAVKVIDDRGNELMVVQSLKAAK